MIAALENHLWQSTLFSGLVALLTLMLRRNRAAVRHKLWLAASVKFLVPFSLLASIASQVEWRNAPAAVRPQLSLVEQIGQPFAQPVPAPLLVSVPTAPSRLPAILFGLWLCGFAAHGLAWWRRWRRVCDALRVASPMHLGLPIRAMSTPSRLEPGVFGIFRPFLLLPEGISEHLTTAQFDLVLAHELCHVRRRDNLAAVVHMLVEALFWFHPLLWWIEARLVEERERACDEEVLLTAHDPQDYAQGIVEVCKLYLKSPLVCISGVTGANLKRRVEAIMMNRGAYRLSFGRRLLLATAGVSAVMVPIAVGVFRTPSVRAQQPAGTLEFDAVSVKASDPNSRNGTVVSLTPGAGLHVINATLKDLIETAYDARALQILGGPSWAGVAKYDVTGTPNPHPVGAVGAIPSQPGDNDVRLKVQAMLKDRFQLQLHREMRIVAIYSLVVAKGGIKPDGLRATDSPHRGVNAGRGTILGEAATMMDLTSKLPRLLDRPVVNNTGLEGKYDFKLEWTPDPGPSAPDSQPAETPLGPSIFSALQQQLGLRLEATKGPVDVLVIDHVDKPSEN
jgi:bla regulator protein blaR1